MQDEGLYTIVTKSLFKLTGSLINIFELWLLIIFRETKSISSSSHLTTILSEILLIFLLELSLGIDLWKSFCPMKQGLSFKRKLLF